MTTYERMKEILASDYSVPAEKLAPDARLEDLGIDSLGVMELMFTIEDEFSIKVPSDQVALQTIGDVVDYVDQLVAAQTATAPAAAPASAVASSTEPAS